MNVIMDKKKCIPISKKDYDLANMLFQKYYQEELKIQHAPKKYSSMGTDVCQVCYEFFSNNAVKSYRNCPYCGAILDPYNKMEKTNG